MGISKRTLVLKVDPVRPDMEAISFAAKKLKGGALVAFPTETVYGLGANILKKSAIDRLYRVKKRPKGKPFTIHISDESLIKKLGCKVTEEARRLMGRYWPGPLTVILAGKGKTKIGFRMPDNIVALRLIEESASPIAAPSANLSGKRSPTDAKDVLCDLDGKIDILLDAGPTDVGVESTIVDMSVTPPRVLREGAIGEEEILSIINYKSQ